MMKKIICAFMLAVFALMGTCFAQAAPKLPVVLNGYTPNPALSFSFNDDRYPISSTQPAAVSISGPETAAGTYTVAIKKARPKLPPSA